MRSNSARTHPTSRNGSHQKSCKSHPLTTGGGTVRTNAVDSLRLCSCCFTNTRSGYKGVFMIGRSSIFPKITSVRVRGDMHGLGNVITSSRPRFHPTSCDLVAKLDNVPTAPTKEELHHEALVDPSLCIISVAVLIPVCGSRTSPFSASASTSPPTAATTPAAIFTIAITPITIRAIATIS